ncbi:MAG: hypothetical protein ACK5IN_10420 [Microbacterium sp.]|uniref:hypothetical protein n=1 Tax=Microbacterium sp. TaxID=51671 RepID=UPI003A89D644
MTSRGDGGEQEWESADVQLPGLRRLWLPMDSSLIVTEPLRWIATKGLYAA